MGEMACMMNGFPWSNCHGKAIVMETEGQSECVSFLDCKQVMTASDTVQQEIVAPGSSYPLYSKPGGNEITTVIVPETHRLASLNNSILAGKLLRGNGARRTMVELAHARTCHCYGPSS